MKRRGIYCSDFLFPVNNFIIGMGSVLSIWGNYFEFNTSETYQKADYKAILSDWGTTGLDLHAAAEQYIAQEKIDLFCDGRVR